MKKSSVGKVQKDMSSLGVDENMIIDITQRYRRIHAADST